MAEPDLYELYGKAPNKKVEPLRMICRDRTIGQNEVMTSVRLEKTATDCGNLAKAISDRDGRQDLIDHLIEVKHVFEHFCKRPGKVHTIIQNQYEHTHRDTGDSHSDYQPDVKCPYEENPDKRMCWSCHVPRKAWQAMKREFESNG